MNHIPFFRTRGIAKECPITWVRSTDKSVTVPYTEEQLKKKFKSCDTNQDEHLSKQELINAFTSIGSRFPAWRAYLALHQADKNGDGYISEDELDKLVKYACKQGYAIK